MKRIDSEKGFIIMEMIMGITIAAAMLLALIDVHYDAMNTIHKTARNQEAVNIAQGYAEEILHMEGEQIVSTYSDYEIEENGYRVCVDLETESENINEGACVGKMEKDIVVEIHDDAILIAGFEMPVRENVDIIINESECILVKPYGISIGAVDSGNFVIFQKGCAGIDSINIKNGSKNSVDVYYFTDMRENLGKVEIGGQNICIQEDTCDFKNVSRLLKAHICVYCKYDLEAEIVTYRNVRY